MDQPDCGRPAGAAGKACFAPGGTRPAWGWRILRTQGACGIRAPGQREAGGRTLGAGLGPVAGAVGSNSGKRRYESEHAIAIIHKVRRLGNPEFSFDAERRADIVESSICLDLSQGNSLKVDESTSFHACQK